MALVAATSVTTFLVSLVMVITSDGSHELSAEVCIYSLVLSFISLIVYDPGPVKKQAWSSFKGATLGLMGSAFLTFYKFFPTWGVGKTWAFRLNVQRQPSVKNETEVAN